MICVSLGNISPDQALHICHEVKLVEIRADLLGWPVEDYKKVFSSGVKTIFTCRPGSIGEKERLWLFRFAAANGASYIDVEYESSEDITGSLLQIRKEYGIQLIISYHNFEATPGKEELESILDSCYSRSADVAKIACRVYSQNDVARLLSLYEKTGRKVILGMGHTGKITRIASLLLGGEFTFASAGSGNETAEGQIDYRTMEKIYNLING